VRLAAGEERAGLDFAMKPVRVVSLEGAVVTSDGRPTPAVSISIGGGNRMGIPTMGDVRPRLVQAPDAGGRFIYDTLAPGHYTLTASANRLVANTTGRGGTVVATDSETLYGVLEVDVDGQPVRGVTLTLYRGIRISGRVTIDPASSARAPDVNQIQVRLVRSFGAPGTMSQQNASGTVASSAIAADGGFQLSGIGPGDYRLQLSLPTDWWLRSAVVGGIDTLDDALRVTPGAGDLANVQLMLSDRRAQVSGTLQTPAGQPASPYYIVLMPADRALWVPASRRLKFTRPASDGTFSFTDLPGGEYILAAVTDLDSDDWQRADFLGELVPSGVKTSLADGEKKIQDLRIR
jgi:hypothetical protein